MVAAAGAFYKRGPEAGHRKMTVHAPPRARHAEVQPGREDGQRLKQRLVALAATQGFALCRVTRPDAITPAGERLHAWLAAGHHAGMGWMAERAEERAAPAALWPEVRSVVMLGMNYGPDVDPLATLALPERGNISVYARGRDYHDVIKGRLKLLAQQLVKAAGRDGTAGVKVFVDTAPVLEKALAEAAGLGWQGKHTVLLSRSHGNWLFLGALFTTLELPPDEPEQDHCGSCTRCLDICPTAAFPAPRVLDSRRCISYLTIEHHGPIDRALRPLMGNRIFGCDDCLAVCPWNKFAEVGREAKLAARAELVAPPLAELVALDDAGFRALFAASPVKRAGHARFLRNVLIAIGNSGAPGLAAPALARLWHPAPVVRGAAIWALGRLLPAGDFARLRERQLPYEADGEVLEEWREARGP
jgi:epoxyqueuosine reductase